MTVANKVREIYLAAMEIPEPYCNLSDTEQEQARELLSRFEDLQTKHGSVPHADLLHPMLLSKCGRHDDALAVTERHHQDSPDWESAVAVANAARRAGDLDRAAAMFQSAAGYDATDVTCWLEIGDIRLAQGRCEEALNAYEVALDKEPEHQWALPSAFYCRDRLGHDGNWLQSLREVANQQGCTCGMQGCLTSLFGGYGSEDGIARARFLLSQIDGESASSGS